MFRENILDNLILSITNFSQSEHLQIMYSYNLYKMTINSLRRNISENTEELIKRQISHLIFHHTVVPVI